ncbi:hypothetical protein M7I_2179 [Glarea lozoyensis 74030]|uniref:Uncharacterized protein n=1 Tax=Glarea lozoyensis (strain ATCC 74030 / MF5533) TaxID=1104152 RepID=H0EI33_GLAL7|nr:hypothetical protein M7I_2179 [Glarea lozoyensis 74030]
MTKRTELGTNSEWIGGGWECLDKAESQSNLEAIK